MYPQQPPPPPVVVYVERPRSRFWPIVGWTLLALVGGSLALSLLFCVLAVALEDRDLEPQRTPAATTGPSTASWGRA